MRLTENDPWLKPYEERIKRRNEYTRSRERSLTCGGDISLSDFASGHLYYGLHKDEQGAWILREFMPSATEVYLIGDFNSWEVMKVYQLKRINDYGDWELRLSENAMKHGDHYKLFVKWIGGCGERIPAWARRVVQDPNTGVFSAQVWLPEASYKWEHSAPKSSDKPLMIYECHIGMSSEEKRVSTYNEFREHVLPRIAELGYNAIQLMAIQEHPYYGSFGYHVSNFYAPSSRFGTPEELKALVDAAHGLGLKVIMDLVHSHAVKNEVEGLARYDGTRTLFFHEGGRGEHPAWDSLCFDYGRNNVIHFLLSNCKYWLEEFHFDGFRFDGVSSMLYYNHGLGEVFTTYADYFNGMQDADAMAYLAIANKLIHTIKPDAITIAEEVSGMPGLASKIEDGGFGFDYRLAMNIPDFWTRLVKEQSDESWSVGEIWYQLTNRRNDEKTVSYVESHDQALVGDKTLIFRLADSDMYWHMSRSDRNHRVDRAVALHKMIRLATATTINGGYLNFMGNEFGHPEWIDFPREGNGWSYDYARRQWSLADNTDLLYNDLLCFDKDLAHFMRSNPELADSVEELRYAHEEDQVLCYSRGDLFFVYNFAPERSYADYEISVPKGIYQEVLDTDSPLYGVYGLINHSVLHHSEPVGDEGEQHKIRIYLPARTGIILQRRDEMPEVEYLGED